VEEKEERRGKESSEPSWMTRRELWEEVRVSMYSAISRMGYDALEEASVQPTSAPWSSVASQLL